MGATADLALPSKTQASIGKTIHEADDGCLSPPDTIHARPDDVTTPPARRKPSPIEKYRLSLNNDAIVPKDDRRRRLEFDGYRGGLHGANEAGRSW